MKMINENLNGKMVLDAFCKVVFSWLNSDEGQKVVVAYRAECLKENPSLTPAEWNEKKAELVGNMFSRACSINSDLLETWKSALLSDLQ